MKLPPKKKIWTTPPSLPIFNSAKVLVISDIHLGHPKTTASFILNNWKKTITYEVLKEIDMFVIAGDLFDRLLMFNQDCIYEITEHFADFLDLLHHHQVIFRVLEGTPSHEWKQSRILVNLNNARKEPVDFKYVTSLEIEHIDSLGLDVLYIPDEYHTDPAVTLLEAKAAIQSRGLTQVHLAIMHGAFEYQLPFPIKTHDATEYSNLVSHYIFIGHHHEHHPNRKIVPPGSFDRLCHGDENPKGFIMATLGKTYQKSSFSFVQNKGAKIYKTLDVQDTSLEQVYQLLDTLEYPIDSHIRLKVKKTDDAFIAITKIKKRYHHFHFTMLSTDEPISKPLAGKEDRPILTVTLTKDNLSQIVVDALRSNKDLDVSEETLALVKEIMDGSV